MRRRLFASLAMLSATMLAGVLVLAARSGRVSESWWWVEGPNKRNAPSFVFALSDAGAITINWGIWPSAVDEGFGYDRRELDYVRTWAEALYGYGVEDGGPGRQIVFPHYALAAVFAVMPICWLWGKRRTARGRGFQVEVEAPAAIGSKREDVKM